MSIRHVLYVASVYKAICTSELRRWYGLSLTSKRSHRRERNVHGGMKGMSDP